MGVAFCSLPCTTPPFRDHLAVFPSVSLSFGACRSVLLSSLTSPPLPPSFLQRELPDSALRPPYSGMMDWVEGAWNGGGCRALRCSMTDGNMHYFPGGPECSINRPRPLKGPASQRKGHFF